MDASLVGLTPVETISKPGKYSFKVSAQDTDNITVGPDQAAGKHTFGYKVENIASFNYGKAALADSYYTVPPPISTSSTLTTSRRTTERPLSPRSRRSPSTTRIRPNPAKDLADGKFGTYTVTVEVADTNDYK